MLNDSRLQECAAYVTERTKHVIETFGPRAPGSEAERKTQELVKNELEAICDGAVIMEPFAVAGKAFFAMQAVSSLLLLISVFALAIHPLLSLALDALAFTVIYFQLVRYKLFLDPFFPKSTSYNVYGSIRPKGEIRRRIILAGHADAAYEWRFAYLFPGRFRYVMMLLIVGVAGIVLLHIAAVAAWGMGGSASERIQLLLPAQWALAPLLGLGIFFNNLKVLSPGANDNLTGVFASVGIAKFLKAAGIQLEHTELGIASLGSEEAGLRGAKEFAQKHKRQFEDVETIFIALETLRDSEHIKVYNRDMNGTVKHDAEVCQLLQDAGRDCGMNLPCASAFLGSSDAAAFTQAGWRAAMFAAMDPAPPPYYHTRRDNWDNMDEECLRKCIAVVCAALRRYDSG